MSAAAIRRVKEAGFKGSARNVAMAMAEVVNGDNECWLSQAELAMRAGVSLRSVARALAQLREGGFIEAISGGRLAGLPTRYRIANLCQNGMPPVRQNGRPPMPKWHAPRTPNPQVTLLPENSKQEIAGTSTRLPLFPAALNGHAPKVDFNAEFDALWELYPNKSEEPAARAAYAKTRRKGAKREQLELAVRHYAEARAGQDPKYTKLGKNFFGTHAPWREMQEPPQDRFTAQLLDALTYTREMEAAP